MADSTFSEGRRASLERRRAISQGKGALPPARERTKTSTTMTATAAPTRPVPPVSSPIPAAAPATSGGTTGGFASEITGRLMSMLRRRQQSAGKSALGSGKSAVGSAPAAPASAPAVASEPVTPYTHGAHSTAAPSMSSVLATAPARGHELARRMRAERAQAKAQQGIAADRPARRGKLSYPPKVVVDTTTGGQTVTGLKYTDRARVTGADEGLGKPVSGTQYISPRDAALRAPAAKVGMAETAAGLKVTGTLVRNRVSITGDEVGERQRITGDLDGRIEDDRTPRESTHYDGIAQFARQANPHGHTVFGTNLGRSLATAGSRSRERERPLETTERGLAITGSAVGRSARVTGDEPGSCRAITGDQYLAPGGRQAECGGQGGGTASPRDTAENSRRDPVTGAKVTVSSTWGGARITGGSVEHDPAVTGDEPGSCRTITGTPYQGPQTMYGWCESKDAAEAESRQTHAAAVAVTGDLPLDVRGVTGTERGAARDITGTPYYQPLASSAAVADPVAAIDAGFSVRSPQRSAQLKHRFDPIAAPTAQGRVTGTFAQGEGKITGNVEFGFTPRRAATDREKLPRISGEGSTRKATVTGDAWSTHERVTGTEGYIAQERNPSERAGKAEPFAGARLFKGKVQHEDPRQIVTGMVGWSPKSAAKVTLSGGAQG